MDTPGQRWKAYREHAGLSAAEAAKLAGVSRQTIYDVEKDDDGVTLRMMRRIAAVYGVTLGEVFRDQHTPIRVPNEFRPLMDALLPLNLIQREALIRNVAANLTFMATTYLNAANEPPSGGEAENPRRQSQEDADDRPAIPIT